MVDLVLNFTARWCRTHAVRGNLWIMLGFLVCKFPVRKPVGARKFVIGRVHQPTRIRTVNIDRQILETL